VIVTVDDKIQTRKRCQLLYLSTWNLLAWWQYVVFGLSC